MQHSTQLRIKTCTCKYLFAGPSHTDTYNPNACFTPTAQKCPKMRRIERAKKYVSRRHRPIQPKPIQPKREMCAHISARNVHIFRRLIPYKVNPQASWVNHRPSNEAISLKRGSRGAEPPSEDVFPQTVQIFSPFSAGRRRLPLHLLP